MTHTARLLCALGTLGASAAPAVRAQANQAPLAIERAVEQIGAGPSLWPGFDPLAVPLAIYDGSQTWLFRHPKPPAGFTPVAGAVPAARSYPGRFPAVTANSSADIGGTPTATLLFDGVRGQQPPAELASVAVHEAFHVYQRAHHPGWVGNEADLMVYPVTDPDLLALRRLETAALHRALANTEAAGAACWARVAMTERHERFAAMDSAFVAYEQLTELNEGLAAYVQERARGGVGVTIPADGFPAEAVRLRTYTTGPALAELLDRLSAGWQAKLESNDTLTLDGLLVAALQAPSAPASAPCGFTEVQIGAAKRNARIDVAAVATAWAARQRAFDARQGWRVLIQSAPDKPLWPQGFDPLNIDRVDQGLIHTRFLKLGNDAGALTALDEPDADIEAHTSGVGSHPMFNGVAWVEVVTPSEPIVERKDGHLILHCPGFSADFANATLVESGQQFLIQLT